MTFRKAMASAACLYTIILLAFVANSVNGEATIRSRHLGLQKGTKRNYHQGASGHDSEEGITDPNLIEVAPIMEVYPGIELTPSNGDPSRKGPKSNKKGGHPIPDYAYVPGTKSKAPSGKGKGGSSKKSSKSSKKAKQAKQAKGDSSSAKSNKAKGSKSMPGPHSPTRHPSPSTGSGSSMKTPTTRPPAPLTTPTPTGSPVLVAPSPFTPSPTDADSVPVILTDFSLTYQPVSRPAMGNEIEALYHATRLYLESFFREEFRTTTMTFLDDFIVDRKSSTYTMGAPYSVGYGATARFNPFSNVFPSAAQLDSALEVAFSGENLAAYEAELMKLPPGNIFRGTTVGFNTGGTVRVAKRSSGPNGAAIAAGAVAATLMAAGLVLYRRRMQEEDEIEKDKRRTPGDITIAGETFTGETHDGTASVEVSVDDLLHRRDEEDGLRVRVSNLGTIVESSDDMNMVSTPPIWRQDSVDHSDLPIRANSSQYLHTKMSDLDDSSDESSKDDYNEQEEISTLGKDAQSFEDVALQGPAHHVKPSRSESVDKDDYLIENDDQASYYSDSEMSNFVASQGPAPENTEDNDTNAELESFLSYDSLNRDKTLSSDESTNKEESSRRPRTVDEIEALLSADMEDDDSHAGSFMDHRNQSFASSGGYTSSSHRPRTVEEIENLLSEDALDGDSTNSGVSEIRTNGFMSRSSSA